MNWTRLNGILENIVDCLIKKGVNTLNLAQVTEHWYIPHLHLVKTFYQKKSVLLFY